MANERGYDHSISVSAKLVIDTAKRINNDNNGTKADIDAGSRRRPEGVERIETRNLPVRSFALHDV